MKHIYSGDINLFGQRLGEVMSTDRNISNEVGRVFKRSGLYIVQRFSTYGMVTKSVVVEKQRSFQ
ncbi:MAG: hypothetical protein WCR04_02710 [Fibrobacteraceae bacterium]